MHGLSDYGPPELLFANARFLHKLKMQLLTKSCFLNLTKQAFWVGGFKTCVSASKSWNKRALSFFERRRKKKNKKRNKGIDEELRIDFKRCPICFNGSTPVLWRQMLRCVGSKSVNSKVLVSMGLNHVVTFYFAP